MSQEKKQKVDGEAKLDERALLMIPGPIEFHEDVLQAMGEQSPSHVAPSFIEEFGAALQDVRRVFLSKDAQPFVVAGSGTLGWEMIGANLLEKGQTALVINTGYFSDSFSTCLEVFGVKVSQLKASRIGAAVTDKELDAVLSQTGYDLVCITQVDTSTGVLNNVQALAAVVRKHTPKALIAVDGVCAFGAEEFRMDDWSIDAAMTASQKALGAPPGLCVLAVSQRAMGVFKARTTAVPTYYSSFAHWLPVMQAYEARTASYFATPPVNNVRALHVALRQLLQLGVEKSFELHRAESEAFKRALAALNLQLVPVSLEVAAHTLSAIRFPKGVNAANLLPKLKAHGVVAAGGLHKEIKAEYFRIGHMGLSVTDKKRGHMLRVVKALEAALKELGCVFPEGAGQKAYSSGSL